MKRSLQWVDVSTLQGAEAYLAIDGDNSVALVKRLGGSWEVRYKGETIAFRPTLEDAKDAAVRMHAALNA